MTRVFIVVASLFGLAFVVLTPPFQAPDEVGHFWRAATLAHGIVIPRKVTPRGAEAMLPRGQQMIVFVLWRDTAGKPEVKFTRKGVVDALRVQLEPEERVLIRFSSVYTPVVWTAQTVAQLTGRALRLRPLITFYLGRILNLALYIALVATALRFAPAPLRTAIAAIALFPMPLYMAASWSGDAMTIGAAFLFLATLHPAASLLVALCKAAYFPLALCHPERSSGPGRGIGTTPSRTDSPPRSRATLGMTAVGVLISFLIVLYGHAPARPDIHIDPAAQIRCIAGDPLRFAGIVFSDLASHGSHYAVQLVGTLGWLDVPLPRAIPYVGWLLLAAIAFTWGEAVTLRTRLLALGAFLASLLLIETSMYIIWSGVCGDVLEGVQGRYFLPIAPLLVLACANPRWRGPRIHAAVIAAFAVIANATAAHALATRYWTWT